MIKRGDNSPFIFLLDSKKKEVYKMERFMTYDEIIAMDWEGDDL